ncbi:MAG: hypothetical protein SFX73_21260 [Kofleriaceae bacterium]|nr:hypothetical protein [Kofleriaceae bacterium]
MSDEPDTLGLCCHAAPGSTFSYTYDYYKYVGPKCGNGACELDGCSSKGKETPSNCPTDCPACSSWNDLYSVNGTSGGSLNTTNAIPGGGNVKITLRCGSGTSYTWTLTSGGGSGGAYISSCGRTLDCYLPSGSVSKQ